MIGTGRVRVKPDSISKSLPSTRGGDVWLSMLLNLTPLPFILEEEVRLLPLSLISVSTQMTLLPPAYNHRPHFPATGREGDVCDITGRFDADLGVCVFALWVGFRVVLRWK